MGQPSSAPDAVFAAIAQAGNEVTQGWMRLLGESPLAESGQASALQAEYFEKQARLWTSLLTRHAGGATVAPEPGDRRFAAREWRDNPYYDYLKQSYLLWSRFVLDAVESAPLERRAKDRARFAARQWTDAMCPANFAASNPEALRQALATNGASLAQGLANLIGDVQKGRISQSDDSAFEVGRNLANSPGSVVYENELIQLLQYDPATAAVARRPLVMVPPCINKFYVLDLQPGNSFVRYAVEAGHTVFMLSWRNVGTELGHLTWDDYLERGVLAALRVAHEIAGSDRINALGFCVGGTLLGAALAVLAARGEDRVASVTYLATMLDFSEPGPIGLFVDEASVAAREAMIGRGGILPGADLAFVFSSLRANDLVWHYVVNNYLLGASPAAFDLLHWNADSTNLPGPMYCYYVRHTYLENKLREPGALVNCGVPVDLGKPGLPAFVLATREDHIVPWRAAYRSLELLGGDRVFVLGASGHIAGVINPAARKRRNYWTGEAIDGDADRWLEAADEHAGSWWPVWSDWLREHAGGTRPAPLDRGNAEFKPIEPAPGRYVKHRVN